MKDSLESFVNFLIHQAANPSEGLLKKESHGNIDIYKNNFLKGHLNHLKTVYPVCLKILGENNFNFFMSQYLFMNPPSSENLNDYGEEIDQFFKNREELSEMPYLIYISKLEWSVWTQADREIILPKGIHELWHAIVNDLSTENIEIDENELEKIRFE
jgi:hypothetical protein